MEKEMVQPTLVYLIDSKKNYCTLKKPAYSWFFCLYEFVIETISIHLYFQKH